MIQHNCYIANLIDLCIYGVLFVGGLIVWYLGNKANKRRTIELEEYHKQDRIRCNQLYKNS